MTAIRKYWWVVVLLFVSLPAFADAVNYQTISAAAQKSNDLSRQALVMIFGDVVTNPLAPTNKTIIGALFGTINGVLSALALIWFMIVTVKGVVKSGHQGQVFNHSRSAVWPIMTFAGFLTLVPTASGWSLSQLTMLWGTSVMGIGSANLLTDVAVDKMDQGYSMVVQPTAPSTRSAARSIFEMNLCKYAINRELQTLYAEGTARTAMMNTRGGNGSYSTSNGSAMCGSAKTPETGRSGVWNNLFDSKVDTESVISAQRQALDAMQSSLDEAASSFVDTYLSKRDQDSGNFQDIESKIQSAAAEYEQTVNQALNRIDFKDSLQSQLVSQLKSNGWLFLGSWYQTFATANSKTNDVASASPVVTGRSSVGELSSGELFNEVFTAYRAQLQNTSYAPPLGTQTSQDDASAASAVDPNAVFVGMFGSPMQRLTSMIATTKIGTEADFSNQVNPLIKMQSIGDATLVTTEVLMAGYAGVWVVASASSNSVLRYLPINLGEAAKDVLGALAPLFYAVMFALFAVGISLAVFLPAVPFLFWMGGAVNWIVSVLVGCAAGPMWAATHLGAEEDKGSRSAYGYVFLIDMMLRPSLMVLGFFFAAMAVAAAGTLLNLFFASALASANANSIVGLVKMIGWLLIYARAATFTVTRIFGLQATLPDYVISFLGGREAANVMGGMVDNMKSVFAGIGGSMNRLPAPRLQDKRKPTSDGIQG